MWLCIFFFFLQLLHDFDQFTLRPFTPPMRQIARLLLTNKQGGLLRQMSILPDISTECKSLGTIVVHAVTVFTSSSKQPILLPFINMLTNPADLMVGICTPLTLFCMRES